MIPSRWDSEHGNLCLYLERVRVALHSTDSPPPQQQQQHQPASLVAATVNNQETRHYNEATTLHTHTINSAAQETEYIRTRMMQISHMLWRSTLNDVKITGFEAESEMSPFFEHHCCALWQQPQATGEVGGPAALCWRENNIPGKHSLLS